ncbi:MAG: ATP synthase F1 subunit epsilon [Microgenomates group bacterium]
MNLQIITPQKITFEGEVTAITVPSTSGEITILKNHEALFTMLNAGVIKINKSGADDFLAIGGGYLETNKEKTILVVSRAYGQDEIDAGEIKHAQEEAERNLKSAVTEVERQQALEVFRRSAIDAKLLSKVKHKRN